MKTKEMFAGFSVAAGKDRFDEQITLGGEPNDCKVSAKDTGGAMCVFEFTGKRGGPPHRHYEQDEWIYIVEGEFDFVVGDKKMRLIAGESIFIPRKTAHLWACVSGKPGKIIDVYQPAGKMEAFFRELGRLSSTPSPDNFLPTAEQMINKTYTEKQVKSLHRFFEAHGMDLLPPPGFE